MGGFGHETEVATTSICSGPHANSPPRSSASASPVSFGRITTSDSTPPSAEEAPRSRIEYTAAGGSDFKLPLDGQLVAAGLHHPATDQLERFRAGIDDDRRATAFERTVVSAEAGGLKLAQPAIKRAPRGYGVDHPGSSGCA